VDPVPVPATTGMAENTTDVDTLRAPGVGEGWASSTVGPECPDAGSRIPAHRRALR